MYIFMNLQWTGRVIEMHEGHSSSPTTLNFQRKKPTEANGYAGPGSIISP